MWENKRCDFAKTNDFITKSKYGVNEKRSCGRRGDHSVCVAAVAITWHAGWSAVAQVMSVNNRCPGGERNNQPVIIWPRASRAHRLTDCEHEWRAADVPRTHAARPPTHRVTTSHDITVPRRTIITVLIELRLTGRRARSRVGTTTRTRRSARVTSRQRIHYGDGVTCKYYIMYILCSCIKILCVQVTCIVSIETPSSSIGFFTHRFRDFFRGRSTTTCNRTRSNEHCCCWSCCCCR